MTSPLTIFVVPSCGLSIHCNVQGHSYKIKDKSKGEFLFINDSSMYLNIWQGKLPPVTELNLSPYAMEKAVILNSTAKKVAFPFPPEG